VSADTLAALGVFLSGAGSVLGAWYALRAERRRLDRECAQRVELLLEGIRIGEQHDEER
jgi:hypothetical protein